MRIVYFDESGIGRIAIEPHLVVAGAMVHADRQYFNLETYLRDMLAAFVPEGQPTPTGFHAKDIYHGTREFHRDRWPSANRFGLLEAMAGVPKTFDLPLFQGVLDRAALAAKYPQPSQLQRDISCYTLAATICLMQVERYMREEAEPDEVASIFFENNDRLRTQIKATHRFLRNPDSEMLKPATAELYLPLTRIIDTPSFQEKTDSSILQVADFCAFAVQRKACRKSNADWLYNPIANNFMMRPIDDLSYAIRV